MHDYISASNHVETILSASTYKNFIKKYLNLNRSYIALVEHNTLSILISAYLECKKNNLKLIPGIEFYFKDEKCPILSKGKGLASRIKYFKIILYPTNQKAFQAITKKISEENVKKNNIYGQEYKIFSWKDLEDLSKYDILVSTSDFEGILSKFLLVGEDYKSELYLKKLIDLFGKENVYLSLVPYPVCSYPVAAAKITLKKNSKEILIPYNSKIELYNVKTGKKLFNTTAKWLLNNYLDNRINLNNLKLQAIYVNFRKFIVKKEYHDMINVESSYVINNLPVDIQLKANRLILQLASKFNMMQNLLIDDNAYYVEKEDKVVQDLKLPPNHRVSYFQHVRNAEEVKKYFKENFPEFKDNLYIENVLFNNTYNWAKRFDNFELKFDYSLPNSDKDCLKIIQERIKKVGRMRWDKKEWVQELQKELYILTKNGVVNLLPYFVTLLEIIEEAKKNGILVGPARGSAASWLLPYILGITDVNPFKFKLYPERFLTLGRIKNGTLPDIDVDFESKDFLLGTNNVDGLLYKKYKDKFAQVSTRSLLRLKSAILDVNRFIKGKLEESVQKISKALPNTPQGVSDEDFVFGYEDSDGHHIPGIIEINKDLQNYIKSRPKEWNVVKRALSLTRQLSRHAAAVLLANEPIENRIAITEINGVKRITQADAPQCEYAGFIKYDFLVVNSLRDINKCISLINERYKKENGKNKIDDLELGYFYHKGKKVYIWDLPQDLNVYKYLWTGDTETIFQLNTIAMKPFVKKLMPKSIEDLGIILALVRPGPLDYKDPETNRTMADEYIERRFGRSKGKIEVLNKLLPDTHGIIIFQENLNKIATDLAGFNTEDAENLRIATAKKKVKLMNEIKPKFIKGASKKISKKLAEEIWNQIVTFARYSFNKCISGKEKIYGFNKTIEQLYQDQKNFKDDYTQMPTISIDADKEKVVLNHIKNITYVGKQPVFKIILEDGKSIKVTQNHKFPTPEGIKLAYALTTNDFLYVIERETLFPCRLFQKQSVSNASKASKLKLVKKRVSRIVFGDIEDVYDVEMKAPYHNFAIKNGIVTSNSHSISYAHITYATAFLKYHYPLEWWTAVLSNTNNKEINEKFYKYVGKMLLPPEINLSTDQFVIDYKYKKIRPSLLLISGLGQNTLQKIVQNRPYKDLKDFIKKNVCGPSITKQLLHIGVLDSLLPQDIVDRNNIVEKIKYYNKIVAEIKIENKIKEYLKKIKEAQQNKLKIPQTILKKIKYLHDNKAQIIQKEENNIDPFYYTLTPTQDLLIRKSIFPMLYIDLLDFMKKYSKVYKERSLEGKFLISLSGKEYQILSKKEVGYIDKNELNNDIYGVFPAFVIEASTFLYKKNTKKAMKLILDYSGYITEKVIWPDRKSGKLNVPKWLKKNSIIWVYISKRAFSPYINLLGIELEDQV